VMLKCVIRNFDEKPIHPPTDMTLSTDIAMVSRYVGFLINLLYDVRLAGQRRYFIKHVSNLDRATSAW
jgi:hypothetical protein